MRWLLCLLAASTCVTPAPKTTPAASAAPAAPAPVAALPEVPSPTPIGGTIVDEQIYGGDAGVNGGALAIDGNGRRFMVGSFRGVATFGDLEPLVSQQEDAYFLALDASGKPLFAKRFGGASLDYGGDVVVDADGRVYISGAFESPTIDLGAGPLRCAGVHDIFLAKFTPDGKLLWARRYGDAQDQISLRLRADPAGGVAATGWFKGAVDFGAGPVRSPWNRSFFVSRIDGDGRARWSAWFGYRLDYAETDSAFDAQGNLYVSGGSDERPPAKNDLGPVLLKFDGRGQRLAMQRFGSGADNMSTAVVVDGDGGLRLVVASRGAVDFGDRPAGGEEALYIASFDRSGTRTWSRRLLVSRMLSVAAARIDAEGNTIIAGQLDEPSGAYGTRENGYIVNIDKNGRVRWTLDIARGGMTWLSGLALDPQGRIVVTGAVGRVAGQRMLNGLLVATIAP